MLEADVLRRIRALETRLDALERLVGATSGLFQPAQQPAPTVKPVPERRRDPYPVCTRCGVGLGNVTGFCCPYQDCPTGLGGAFSQARID